MKRFKHFLLIIAFALPIYWATNCDPVKPGGPCKYDAETGYIKIIGFGDTIDNRIQIVFTFYSNKYSALPQNIFADSNCIKNLNVQAGNKYGCIRKEETEGSCVPLIYVFDTIPCFNEH